MSEILQNQLLNFWFGDIQAGNQQAIEQAVALLPLTFTDDVVDQQLALQHYQLLQKKYATNNWLQRVIELFL